MYTANLVSAYILSLNKLATGETLDNMQLNKLLYLCQGYCIAQTGKRLFKENIEAWEHGPVIYEVYEKYNSFGNKKITADCDKSVDNLGITSEDKSLIIEVLCEYGKKEGRVLARITHNKKAPWYTTYHKQESYKHSCIEDVDMLAYFSDKKNRIKSISEKLSDISTIHEVKIENGIFIEI